MSDGQTDNATDNTPQNDATTADAATPANSGQTGGEPTLSQSQVNNLVGTARKEGRDKAIADLLSDLGLEKADDLKALVSDYRAAQDAQLSELEKANRRAEALEAEKARIAQEKDQLAATMRTDRIRHALEIEAARQGYNDPADAYSLIDLGTIKVGEDGAIAGVEEALKELTKAKPYLLKSGTPPRPLGTPRPRADGQRPQAPAPDTAISRRPVTAL